MSNCSFKNPKSSNLLWIRVIFIFIIFLGLFFIYHSRKPQQKLIAQNNLDKENVENSNKQFNQDLIPYDDNEAAAASKYDFILLKDNDNEHFGKIVSEDFKYTVEFVGVKYKDNKITKKDYLYKLENQDDKKRGYGYVGFRNRMYINKNNNMKYILYFNNGYIYRINYNKKTNEIIVDEIDSPAGTHSDNYTGIDSIEKNMLAHQGVAYYNKVDSSFYPIKIVFNEKIKGKLIEGEIGIISMSRYVDDNTILFIMPASSPKLKLNLIAKYIIDSGESKSIVWGYYPMSPAYKSTEHELPLDISKNNKAAFISCFGDIDKKSYELWLSIWNLNNNKVEKVALIHYWEPSIYHAPILTWNNNDNYEFLLACNINNLCIIDTQKKEIIKTLGSIPSSNVLSMRWSNSGEKLGILYYTYPGASLKVKDRKLFIYDLVKDSETLIENIPADSFDFFWVD